MEKKIKKGDTIEFIGKDNTGSNRLKTGKKYKVYSVSRFGDPIILFPDTITKKWAGDTTMRSKKDFKIIE